MATKAEDILEQLGGPTVAEAAVRTREALPDMEAHNPTLRWMVHLGAPLIASVIAHVSLFVALGLARWDLGAARPVADYSAGITDATPPDEGFKWPTETPQDKSETPDDWPTDVAKIENLETPQTPDANVTSEASGGGFGELGTLGTSGVIGMGSGMGEGGGRGGPGEGFGARGGAAIFNFSADGSKFVYVLDFSGSVIVAVDDLKRELKRSVASLQASNEFNVVLFYEQIGTGKLMVDGFQSALTAATGPNKQSFFDWISKKAPNGGTAPVDALKRAIAMKPDAVFFFSDGGFDNEVISTVTKANGRKVQINCLVFDEILINDRSGLPKVTDGAKRMQKLADENRGKCKIVTGRDIEKGAKGAK